MNICITGANGYIGKLLLRRLEVDTLYQVTILKRNRDSVVHNHNVRVVYGDLTDDGFNYEDFLRNCDVLVNCAGNFHDESLMYELHVRASIKLFQKFVEISKDQMRTSKWIQLSSVGAYGLLNHRAKVVTIVNESSKCNPKSKYECTKLEFDRFLVNSISETTGINTVIIRPSNIFGPNMKNKSLRSLVVAIKKGRFFYFGNKSAILTYVHETDVVNSIILSIRNKKASGIYNVSQFCTVREFVEIVGYPNYLVLFNFPESFIVFLLKARFLNRIFSRIFNENRYKSLTNRYIYSSSRIMSEINFKFEQNLPMQLRQYVANI